jgi:Spy/CpxP family protein refolding chaperone
MYGPGSGHGWMMGGDPAYTQQRLDELKTRLGITTDQETAWNGFADALAARTGIHQAHRQAMFENAPVSPEQRLAFHQQGFTQMKKIADARHDLYTVLTPEQQARLDTVGGLRTCLR